MRISDWSSDVCSSDLVEGVDIPPATAAQARRVLARRPLNQPVLNLLFAIESRGTLDPERRETFIDTIKALGWRDTPSQQHLIVETLRDGDPREAVMRAAALLRRSKLKLGRASCRESVCQYV